MLSPTVLPPDGYLDQVRATHAQLVLEANRAAGTDLARSERILDRAEQLEGILLRHGIDPFERRLPAPRPAATLAAPFLHTAPQNSNSSAWSYSPPPNAFASDWRQLPDGTFSRQNTGFMSFLAGPENRSQYHPSDQMRIWMSYLKGWAALGVPGIALGAAGAILDNGLLLLMGGLLGIGSIVTGWYARRRAEDSSAARPSGWASPF